jgi:hypothetical protein
VSCERRAQAFQVIDRQVEIGDAEAADEFAALSDDDANSRRE